MADAVPTQVTEAGLEGWYSGLTSQDKVRVRRYVEGIDTSSELGFITDLMARAVEDHNYKLAVIAGLYLGNVELSSLDRFIANEGLIEGLFGCDMFAEGKELCKRNLALWKDVKDDYIAKNGFPEHLSCRNRMIDILVGVEGDYDAAFVMLDDYCEMGLIDEEEKAYRKQSLKIHRMQRSFDNMFNFKSE